MWYNKYSNLPYKHLGENPETGIDCFNLGKLIYKQERNIIIPYNTATFCNDQSSNWYYSAHNELILNAAKQELGWDRVQGEPQVFDVLLMHIGASNIINHCAWYIDKNLILQTAENRVSWISVYGRYYKTYTNGNIYRWIGLPKN